MGLVESRVIFGEVHVKFSVPAPDHWGAVGLLSGSQSCSLRWRQPAGPFTPTGPNAQVVVTTGDQAMLLKPEPTISFGTGGSQSSPVITVNEATQYQSMDGFGASLTDSSAWLI